MNRAGLTFVHDMRAGTGRTAADVTRATASCGTHFGCLPYGPRSKASTTRSPARVQTEILLDIAAVIEHAATWLLRSNRLDIGREIARFAPAVGYLATAMPELLPADDQSCFEQRKARFVAAGIRR